MLANLKGIFAPQAVAQSLKTLPPLRTQRDVDALIAAVKDGTIDCIVSDHRPCTPFSKKQDFISAPQGMVSLDTFLPAIYTKLIRPGKLSWEEVVRACSENPFRIADPRDPEMDTELQPPLMLCVTISTGGATMPSR